MPDPAPGSQHAATPHAAPADRPAPPPHADARLLTDVIETARDLASLTARLSTGPAAGPADYLARPPRASQMIPPRMLSPRASAC